MDSAGGYACPQSQVMGEGEKKMKHKELIDQMTLEEKAAILSGRTVWETREVKRLGIPSIFLSDGPHGIRKQAGAGDHLGLNASLEATCFPTAATVANSWNEQLGEEIGEALGEEARAMEVNVLLGPGLNIKRSPLCGRNFEYFSEDPYLSGKMAAAYVRGIQKKGVYACLKHFAANSQELRRMSMDSVVDERALREIYLTGFEIAVKEGHAKSIMSSYNKINGVYANEDRHLLKEILRDEWGFDGFVVTDWGGSNDHVKGVEAGSNLEMPAPGLDSAREILRAVENQTLDTEVLDACVDDLLDAVLTLKKSALPGAGFDQEAHHRLAKKAAMESAVLLKNEGNILPLKPKTKTVLIGDFVFTPRYQGAGSSMVNPTKVEALAQMAENYHLQVVGMARGYQRNGEPDEEQLKEAVELAKKADVVIYAFGLDELSESEGLDRSHMRIPENQIRLLKELYQANPNIVGILSGGSAVEMPWHTCCKAILHGYLTGQAGAGALLDLLTGKANPSGRLNETCPLRYEDTPAFHYFPSKERTAEYRESIYVGYRYYDTAKAAVQYPFGHGLSYTEFAYSNLKVTAEGVTLTVTNTGEMDGAEVVQMYVGLPGAEVFRPEKELKGFAKIFLKKGESREVSISFDDKTFRYWNERTGGWEIEGGSYTIMVGASVSDIRLTGSVTITGTTRKYPCTKEELPFYFTGKIRQVEDAEYTKLLGRSIPDGSWNGELGRNDAICQMYYAKSWLARAIYRRLTAMKKKSEAKGKPDLNILFIYNMPFRGIAKMTNGAVSMEMVDGMVLAVNGHFFRGLGKIISGYFRNARANRAYEKRLKTE